MMLEDLQERAGVGEEVPCSLLASSEGRFAGLSASVSEWNAYSTCTSVSFELTYQPTFQRI